MNSILLLLVVAVACGFILLSSVVIAAANRIVDELGSLVIALMEDVDDGDDTDPDGGQEVPGGSDEVVVEIRRAA